MKKKVVRKMQKCYSQMQTNYNQVIQQKRKESSSSYIVSLVTLAARELRSCLVMETFKTNVSSSSQKTWTKIVTFVKGSRNHPPKPMVCIPLVKELNESVAMDHKELDSRSVLHMIDHARRFSKACVIPSKKKEVIVSKICEIWISVFGTPKRILSDNGGEFYREDLREMGEKFKKTTNTTTVAESPWSNGINERHNAIIGDMI